MNRSHVDASCSSRADYLRAQGATVGEIPTSSRESRATCASRRMHRDRTATDCSRPGRKGGGHGEQRGRGTANAVPHPRCSPCPPSSGSAVALHDAKGTETGFDGAESCSRGELLSMLRSAHSIRRGRTRPRTGRSVLGRSHASSPKADVSLRPPRALEHATRCHCSAYAERSPWRRSCLVGGRFVVRTSSSTL